MSAKRPQVETATDLEDLKIMVAQFFDELLRRLSAAGIP